MNAMKKNFFLILLVLSQVSFSQTPEDLKSRLSSVKNTNGCTYYNMDGYHIVSEVFQNEFNEKGLKKTMRKYNIKNEKGTKDESLGFNNLYISVTNKVTDNCLSYASYYLVENRSGSITAVSFVAVNKHNQDFERAFTQMVLNDQIPPESFNDMKIGSAINFAGRKLPIKGECYWTDINTIQCPYSGEMNWSVHKDADDAQLAVDGQLAITKSRDVKIVSQNEIDVVFEDVPTKVVKIVFDLSGINSVLAATSGGKTLTAYYVVAQVRGNYISCVMSHWNNDDILPSGLPLLLDSVMKLK